MARMPDSASFEQAAAVGVAATTALQAIRDQAQVREGQRVVITGASGGVGPSAVPIAKIYGAQATAAASTLNPVMVLAPGGRVVMVGGPNGHAYLGPFTHLAMAMVAAPVPRGTFLPFISTSSKTDLVTLRDWMQRDWMQRGASGRSLIGSMRSRSWRRPWRIRRRGDHAARPSYRCPCHSRNGRRVGEHMRTAACRIDGRRKFAVPARRLQRRHRPRMHTSHGSDMKLRGSVGQVRADCASPAGPEHGR